MVTKKSKTKQPSKKKMQKFITDVNYAIALSLRLERLAQILCSNDEATEIFCLEADILQRTSDFLMEIFGVDENTREYARLVFSAYDPNAQCFEVAECKNPKFV